MPGQVNDPNLKATLALAWKLAREEASAHHGTPAAELSDEAVTGRQQDLIEQGNASVTARNSGASTPLLNPKSANFFAAPSHKAAPCPPSPSEVSAPSSPVFDGELSRSSSQTSRASNLEALPGESDAARKLRTARAYLKHVARQSGFVSAEFGYFAARFLKANVRVWSAPEIDDGRYAYRDTRPATLAVNPAMFEGASGFVDIAHNGINHYMHFGHGADALLPDTRAGTFTVAYASETPDDGNCYFHALAQQCNYANYNGARTKEEQLTIANHMRTECAALASRLVDHPETAEEAIEQLCRCAHDEAQRNDNFIA